MRIKFWFHFWSGSHLREVMLHLCNTFYTKYFNAVRKYQHSRKFNIAAVRHLGFELLYITWPWRDAKRRYIPEAFSGKIRCSGTQSHLLKFCLTLTPAYDEITTCTHDTINKASARTEVELHKVVSSVPFSSTATVIGLISFCVIEWRSANS